MGVNKLWMEAVQTKTERGRGLSKHRVIISAATKLRQHDLTVTVSRTPSSL